MANLFIITGTTRGLGKSFYDILAGDENNLIMTINRKEIVYENKNKNFCFDLSKTVDTMKPFEELLESYFNNDLKKIVFMNNAFTFGELNKIDKLDVETIQNSVNTNLVSAALLLKTFIHKTKDLAVEKRIINISSGAAKRAIDGWSLYCMTKAAMEMFISSIAVEYDDYRSFNVDPGVMDTGMQESIRGYKEGVDYDYFMELFENDSLKDTDRVALDIIEKYIR